MDALHALHDVAMTVEMTDEMTAGMIAMITAETIVERTVEMIVVIAIKYIGAVSASPVFIQKIKPLNNQGF